MGDLTLDSNFPWVVEVLSDVTNKMQRANRWEGMLRDSPTYSHSLHSGGIGIEGDGEMDCELKINPLVNPFRCFRILSTLTTKKGKS